MNRPICVLVLGVGGNLGQGILKALRLSPIPYRTIAACISPLASGLFTADRGYVSPSFNDPQFLSWLQQICLHEKIDVILTGVEPVLFVLAEHAEEIKKSCGTFCLVSPPSILNLAQDKLKTCLWLEKQGFHFPQYKLASPLLSLDQLWSDASFPLIAKPRYGRSGSGIIKIEDKNSLTYALNQKDYLLQEYIGSADEEFTVGTFSDQKGKVCGVIVMKRELLNGTTYRAVLGDFPEVEQEARKIVDALKPLGPCNLQFRIRADGKPICFEINMRFSGTTPFRARFGFNEVDAAIRHFVLGESEIVLPKVTKGVALRYWNEIYVDPQAVSELTSHQKLDEPRQFKTIVEDYGI